MTKFRDTDFLHATSRVKVLEKKMLTARQLQQMVDAHTIDEAYKMAADAGIGSGGAPAEYERAIGQNLLDTYAMLESMTGMPEVFNIFRFEYDALNLKLLIKSHAVGKEPELLEEELGTVPKKTLIEEFKLQKYDSLPAALAQGALEAHDVLARTNDPQWVDIIVDKAMIQSMVDAVRKFDNRFLRKLVETKVDILNIRCLVRIKRMDKGLDFFKRVVAEGGSISVDALLDAYTKGMDQIVALIEGSRYASTLDAAIPSIRANESLSLFEKLCDNAQMAVLNDAKLVPFGIEPLLSYLSAKESELKAVRIVLASRLAGVKPDLIKERLRETYA